MEFMDKLKKVTMEPRIYAILVKSPRGQILHLGVHFSLEEAYGGAKKKLEQNTSYIPGESMDVQLWNSLPAREIARQMFVQPTQANKGPETPVFEGVDKNFSDVDTDEDENVTGAEMDDDLAELLLGHLEKLDVNKLPIKIEKAEKKKTPTHEDHVSEWQKAKNEILNSLVDAGDESEVEKMKEFMTKNERNYVLRKILENRNKKERAAQKEEKDKKNKDGKGKK